MLISPAVFDYTSPAATWNSVIFGGLVIVFAWIRLASKARAKALSWWNASFGAWLIIAPFVLGYRESGGVWNSVIAGVLILALGAWSGSLPVTPRTTTHSHGH